MSVEILTIGDEITTGAIVDTNAVFMAERLTELGLRVTWMTSCTDDAADIRASIRQACGRARRVFISGGLGPTEDDRTVDALAEVAGVPVVVDEDALARMRERFGRVGFELTPNNMRQVRVLEGAEVLTNRAGLAPGFRVRVGEAEVWVVPGVPREMKRIWQDEIDPRLQASVGAEGTACARTFHIYGMGESHIDHRLAGLTGGDESVSIHFRVVFPENRVKVVVRDVEVARAKAKLAALEEEIRRRLGHHIYGIDGDSLAAAVGRRLRADGATLALGESCTGGLCAQLVTAVAGSSDYFLFGAVTYSNQAKQDVLGVRAETLAEHGAVSEACVREMAEGAKRVGRASFGVGISGVAGPGGGTAEKPIGTVHVAVAGPSGIQHRQVLYPGDREQVRLVAAHLGLGMLLRYEVRS
jgi:nicotinamide-nucleotide amidase